MNVYRFWIIFLLAYLIGLAVRFYFKQNTEQKEEAVLIEKVHKIEQELAERYKS